MTEHNEPQAPVELADNSTTPNRRCLDSVQGVLGYEFSQIDFSQPEIHARLGRAYAILLKRAKRQIPEKDPGDYTDIGADAPKERRVSNE
jgi:hypothetical protein